MKKAIIAVTAITIAFLAVNCHKKSESSDPKGKDQKVDVATDPSVFVIDPRAMADQKKLSDAQAKLVVPVASQPTSKSATSEPTSAPTSGEPASAPAAPAQPPAADSGLMN